MAEIAANNSLKAIGFDDRLTATVTTELKAMNNMEVEDQDGDKIIFGDIGDALLALKAMIPAKEDETDTMYDFKSVHLGKSAARGKTKDDIYRGFLYWSQKDEDVENECFNITKAFKRLTSFAKCQDDYFEKYWDTPVYLKEIRVVNEFMSAFTPEYEVAGGSPLWAYAMGSHGRGWDLKEWGITDKLLMRWFWYTVVCCLFDKKAQHPGVVIVQSFNNMGVGEMVKMNNAFSGIEKEMNRMFYGCLPVKMKSIIIVGSPWWMSALMRIMRLFLSKKMSERFKNVSIEKMHQLIGGKTMLPKDYLGGVTTMTERWPQADTCEEEDKKAEEEEATEEVLL